jgi:membrane protease YdiL (CAAX protease family)
MAKLRTMLEDARLQIALLPRPIQNWMLWLNVVFLVGLLFVSSHEAVRWVIAAYVVCFPVAVPIYIYTRDISMSGVPHILFWTPLLIYLPVDAAEDTNFSLLSLYGVWTVLLLLTIAISVVYDVRAVLKYFLRKSQN